MSISKSLEKQQAVNITLPDNIEAGDIIVAKYETGQVEQSLPWENWHHAGLVSEVSETGVAVIEAP